MVETETAQALDLSVLVERLRLSGFRIDTRQYLTAHELLLALAMAGVQLDDDPDRLVTHLGPIFCTSVHEQDLFADEVRQWFGREHPRPNPTARMSGQQTKGMWSLLAGVIGAGRWRQSQWLPRS